MALKQMDALAALREAAGEVIETSLCDVQGSWLALVNTEEGKRLALIDHALILMRVQRMTPEQVLELFQVPKKQRPGLLKTLQTCVKQKPEKFQIGHE